MFTVKPTILKRIVLLAAIWLITGTLVFGRITFTENGFECKVLPSSNAVMILEYKTECLCQ